MFSWLLGECFLLVDWERIIVHDTVDDVFLLFVVIFKQVVRVQFII